MPALDGLRGLAILLVVAFHAQLLPGGWVGVSLFFALSGYLITSLLLGEHVRTGTICLPDFYRRRALRLGPALLVALAGMWALWAASGLAAMALVNVLVTLLYLVNVVRAFAQSVMWPAGWAWSLSIEEQFYAIWPALLRRLLGRHGRHRIALVLLTVAATLQLLRFALGEDHTALDYSLLRGDDIMLGAALALTAWRCPRWLAPLSLIGFSVLVFVPEGRLSFSITAATLSSAGLVAVVISFPRLAALLCVRPLRYLGRISYSLYLWNGIITTWWMYGTRAAPRGLRAAELTALGMVLAVTSTHLLEEPVRRRLTRRGPRLAVPGLAVEAWTTSRWSHPAAARVASGAPES